MIAPQLAHVCDLSTLIVREGEWAVEEKLDGHRIICSTAETGGDLFGNPSVRAHSRDGIERLLPPHLRLALECLPSGVYDGELLVPGKRSYGVTVLEDASKLCYVIFDVLELLGKDTTQYTYDVRRSFLAEIFTRPYVTAQKHAVMLVISTPVSNVQSVRNIATDVWAADGEGLILKRRESIYRPGKRSRDWLKIKQLRSAVLTVVAFVAGKNGPHATLLLRDAEGFETTVKTLNNEWLERFDAGENPIGRRLVIEFQERTPDGAYRHPRWDRWENE